MCLCLRVSVFCVSMFLCFCICVFVCLFVFFSEFVFVCLRFCVIMFVCLCLCFCASVCLFVLLWVCVCVLCGSVCVFACVFFACVCFVSHTLFQRAFASCFMLFHVCTYKKSRGQQGVHSSAANEDSCEYSVKQIETSICVPASFKK